MSTMTRQADAQWQWGGEVEGSHSFVPAMESLESRLLLSVVDFTGKAGTVMSYLDGEGCKVTVTIKGGGTGQLNFQDQVQTDESGHVVMEDGSPVMDIITNHASPILIVTGATSKTTVTVTVQGATKGATTTIIGLSIDGEGLKAINAAKVNISGYDVYEVVETGMEVYELEFDRVANGVVAITNGAGSKITLGNLSEVRMELGGETGKAGAVTNLKLGMVQGNSTITAPGLAMSLTATSFEGELEEAMWEPRNLVTARYFTTITIAESFIGAILTTGANAKGVSVGTMKVGWVFFGGIHGWDVEGESMMYAGRINTLKAGTFERLFVGADSLGALTSSGYAVGGAKSSGDFNGALILAGDNLTRNLKGNTLGSVKVVGGNMSAGIKTVKGNVGRITVGQLFYGQIELGYAEVAEDAWDYTGSIKTMAVGGFIGEGPCRVSAASIGSLSVKGYMDGPNKVAGPMNGDIYLSGYGVTNGNTLNTFTATGDVWGAIEVVGSIGTITVSHLFYGTISVTYNEAAEFGGTNTGAIRSMTTGNFDGNIYANSIGSLTSRGYAKDGARFAGSMWGEISLGGHGITTGKVLNSVRLLGTLRGTIDVHGNVGTITMVNMAEGNIVVSGKATSIKIANKNVLFDKNGVEGPNWTETDGVRHDFYGRLTVLGGTKVAVGRTSFTLPGGDDLTPDSTRYVVLPAP